MQNEILELRALEADRQRAIECPRVWAQLLRSEEDLTKPPTVPFLVTPAIANIDGLKKAVKVERDASNPKDPLNFFSLKVFAHAADAEALPNAALVENDMGTAYRVVVGS